MEEYQDRLSELPQSLIHLIFSFLPIRDVVSTTLLSKRWVNLWTTVPYLNFCEIIREDEDVGDRSKDEGDRIEKEDEDEDNGTKDEDGDNRTEFVGENNGDRTEDKDDDDDDDGTEDEDEEYDHWTEDEDDDCGTEDEDEDDVYGTEDEDEFDVLETESEDDEDDTEDEEYEGYRINAERFRKFVSRALTLWKGIKILKFKIEIESHYGSELVSDVHMWTLFAVNNKVEDLELIAPADYWSPPCLNSCSSVRKLSFVGCVLRMDKSPCWNQLKSLRIDTLDKWGYFSGEWVNWILLGSPKLEEFELLLGGNCDDFSISSRSLKKLKIEKYFYFDEDEDEEYLNTLRICCPNLEKLEISGLFGKCLFIDVSSLVDANLHFYNGHYDYYDCPLPRLYELVGETLEHIFSTIQHVEKIALSDLCFKVLGAHKKYMLSPLLNVKFLKLDVWQIELIHMVDLLGIFPNLKRLVIEHHAFTNPPIFKYMEFETSLCLLHLKIVEITVDFSDFSIFGFIEFLLKHTILLEKLLLRPKGITSCQQHKTFSQKLLSLLPKSSPPLKVVILMNKLSYW